MKYCKSTYRVVGGDREGELGFLITAIGEGEIARVPYRAAKGMAAKAEAHADLMTSAPDLLEALDAMVDEVLASECWAEDEHGDRVDPDDVPFIGKALRALAKARGGRDAAESA